MTEWADVETEIVDGVEVKMYKDLYEANRTVSIPYKEESLDLLAFNHLGTELLWSKILDINAKEILENRGLMKRIKKILIPVA